jgi:hypothetical protein
MSTGFVPLHSDPPQPRGGFVPLHSDPPQPRGGSVDLHSDPPQLPGGFMPIGPRLDRTSLGQREPGSRLRSTSMETGAPKRVILIERCSGVQVGRDNDQVSAYRVTLPTAAFGSGQALADLLLSRDAPWSRDMFTHSARPDFSLAVSAIMKSGSCANFVIVVTQGGGSRVCAGEGRPPVRTSVV